MVLLVRLMWWCWLGAAMGLCAGMLIGEDELAAIFASFSLILTSRSCDFVAVDRRFAADWKVSEKVEI